MSFYLDVKSKVYTTKWFLSLTKPCIETNATHAMRGSATLGGYRPMRVQRERSGVLSNGSFFSFVSFHLWNEHISPGIRKHFKQGRSAVLRPDSRSIFILYLVLSPSLSHPSCVLDFVPVVFLSPLCSSVIYSRSLRVGYSERCYGLWPQFSTQLLISSHLPSAEWLTVCVRVCRESLITLYCLPLSVWM